VIPTAVVERPNQPPLPVAEPELPEGEVALVSALYVERPPIEQQCYQAILKPGALIRIKAPRQMGKTSLMSRMLNHAEQADYRTVRLSFQLAKASVFGKIEDLLQWLGQTLTFSLGLPLEKWQEYWAFALDEMLKCSTYLESVLLPALNQPLVIGLDEVDRIFSHQQTAEDFLGLLRVWHEKSKNQAIWKRLHLVLVHSTEVYIPLSTNQSPFNVGLPIDLPELGPVQILTLAERHGFIWQESDLTPLINLLGGHPYLIRVALYQLQQGLSLAQLLEIAPRETGPFREHLKRQWWDLEQDPRLLNAFKQVVRATEPIQVDSELGFKLASMGLVRRQANAVMLGFELYRQYFSDRLHLQ
jgi:serine/threonine-protein kinase